MNIPEDAQVILTEHYCFIYDENSFGSKRLQIFLPNWPGGVSKGAIVQSTRPPHSFQFAGMSEGMDREEVIQELSAALNITDLEELTPELIESNLKVLDEAFGEWTTNPK